MDPVRFLQKWIHVKNRPVFFTYISDPFFVMTIINCKGTREIKNRKFLFKFCSMSNQIAWLVQYIIPILNTGVMRGETTLLGDWRAKQPKVDTLSDITIHKQCFQRNNNTLII